MTTMITGGFLVAAGIFCFANPGAPFTALAFILGMAMLLSGLSNLFAFLRYRKRSEFSKWHLAEGLVTGVLATVLLTEVVITELLVVVFFGMWILFSGTLRVVASMTIHKLRIKGWAWDLGFGLTSMAAGIYSFYNPFVAGLTMALLLGGIFVLQGANSIVAGVHLKSRKKSFSD